MKRVMTAALLSLCLAAPAMASKELAQAKNCLGCHAVDSKMVGPGATVAMTPAGFVEPSATGATLLDQTLNILQTLGAAAHNQTPATPKSPSSRASYKVSE